MNVRGFSMFVVFLNTMAKNCSRQRNSKNFKLTLNANHKQGIDHPKQMVFLQPRTKIRRVKNKCEQSCKQNKITAILLVHVTNKLKQQPESIRNKTGRRLLWSCPDEDFYGPVRDEDFYGPVHHMLFYSLNTVRHENINHTVDVCRTFITELTN